MKKKVGDILKFVFFIGLGIFFIYWFLLKLDAEQKQAIWHSFTTANYGWVVVCMVVCLLSHFVRALRWQLLLQPVGYKPRLGHTFGAVVVAYMANLVFPRLGEVMRCAVLRTSDEVPVEKSLGTVITERLVDMLCFLLIVLLGLLFIYDKLKDWLYDTVMSSGMMENPHHLVVLGLILMGIGALCIVLYLLMSKKLQHVKMVQKVNGMVKSFADGIRSIFQLRRQNLLLFVLYSVAIYFLYICGGWLIFKAFPETHVLGFEAAFMLYLFGSVGMTFSQGGIGVYPVLVAEALTIYNVNYHVCTACGWLLWGSQQAIVILVGMAFLIYFSVVKKHGRQGASLEKEGAV